MVLLSERPLLGFITALLTAVMIKSTYLSWSLVYVSPKKSAEPTQAASSVDSNISLSVRSNRYLVWLIDEFLCGGASIETRWVGDRFPSRHLFGIGRHALLNLVI